MARIAAATLLLVILVDCFSDKTAHCDEFRSAGFTTREIRKCRSSVTPRGRIKCPHRLTATNYEGQKACRRNPNGLLKVKKGPPPQTHTFNKREKLTLKHCLCCKIKNKRRDRTPAVKAFCNFSCNPPTPF